MAVVAQYQKECPVEWVQYVSPGADTMELERRPPTSTGFTSSVRSTSLTLQHICREQRLLLVCSCLNTEAIHLLSSAYPYLILLLSHK